jgi:hypothetical protein
MQPHFSPQSSIILYLASIHALPTPDQATISSNSTASSTGNTAHYLHATQHLIVATVDLWGVKVAANPKYETTIFWSI